MKTKQFISEFNSDLQVAILGKDDFRYEIMKPMFDEYGFGFIVPAFKLIVIDGEVAKNKTLKEYREELETAGTYNKLPFQNQYTIADAQKLLNKSQFNNFASDAAAKIFETSEKNGTPSIRDGKQTIDTSRKYIKDFAAGKNIELDFNTPAVNYAAKLYTGESNYSKMSKGQKELFLARLQSVSYTHLTLPTNREV